MLEKIGYHLESRYKKKLSNHKKFNSIYNSKLIKPYMQSYLQEKLRKKIQYAYMNSSFYHRLYSESYIDMSNIKTLRDIQQLPFTTSEDILNPEMFFCVPKKDLVKTFQTSGTMGKPKTTFFTKEDLENQIVRNRIGLQTLYDIKPSDSVRIYYGPRYAVFYCAYHALKQIGSSISYSQKRKTAKEEYKILGKNNLTAIIGNPSYFFSLSSALHEIYDLESLGIKSVILGAEPLPEQSRKKYEEIWNTDIYSAYGINEIGVSIGGECKGKHGIHVTETDFFVEVIDSKTGAALEDGEKGEIVFTTLNRMGMPLIRYRTNDIGYIISDDCSCNLPFKRIMVESRKDDMFLLGYGENMYPADLDQKILSIPSIINYQLEIDRKNGKDYLTFIVESEDMENREMITDIIHDKLMGIGQIKRGIHDSRLVEIKDIIIKKTNSINKKNLKQKKIIDKRNLYINQ